MQTGPYRFDRTELAGSLGDLGTLVPLVTALVALGKVNPITAFLLLGIFYILSGLYYRVPVPIQPLKALAAIAIGSQAVSPQRRRWVQAEKFGVARTNELHKKIIERIFKRNF